MTQQEADDAFEIYEQLCDNIHNLIDHEISSLTSDQQMYIRDRLMDEFRFWKRIKF